MISKMDVLIVSQNEKIVSRCIKMCTENNYAYTVFASSDDLFEKSETIHCQGCILIDASHVEHESEIAGNVQVMRQLYNDACIIACINSKMRPEAAVFIKKSGASLILLEHEVIFSSKLDFYAAQFISVAYMPVKPVEIPVNVTFPCTLYHIMPLNKRYLPVFPAQTVMDQNRIDKIAKVGEVYVKRADLLLLEETISKNTDLTEAGYNFRARFFFKSLCKVYSDLIFLITDQSEFSSYEKAQELYANCRRIASKLLNNLVVIGEPWLVISYSAEGDLGTVERGPAIAAYAGVLSELMKVTEPIEVMMGALLGDIGLLDMDSKVTQKVREENISSLHPEEIEAYHKHPIISLNRCLSRKLQLSETTKNAISYVHERIDQTGFPHGLREEKIPFEAMLVKLCTMLDKQLVVKFGKERIHPGEAKKRLFEEISKDPGLFSTEFKNLVWDAWFMKKSEPTEAKN